MLCVGTIIATPITVLHLFGLLLGSAPTPPLAMRRLPVGLGKGTERLFRRTVEALWNSYLDFDQKVAAPAPT